VRVRYTLPALADLDAIMEYIAARSPQGAERVKARVKSFIELLPDHPFLGTRTEDPTIRRVKITPFPYLVFYEATADEIVIHAIRHSGRSPSTMPGSAEQ
jgi:toxin ParE1/3/4